MRTHGSSYLIAIDDFETRKTLRSLSLTHSIWLNIEEAKDGAVYTCNYLSESGNVHKLVQRQRPARKVLIVPIRSDGAPTWDAYTAEDIAAIEADAEDFAGEYLCEPALSRDLPLDRRKVDSVPKLEPIKDKAGFRIYREFDASPRYAAGADVAGRVGLDSSASVFIDSDTVPADDSR